MILLWFICGILLALGIARYNESNKLFWQLSIAFLLGYAITVMVSEKEDDVNLTQANPTQGQISTPDTFVILTQCTDSTSTRVTGSIPVSQGYIPVIREKNIIPSEITRRTRDQPLDTLKPPPQT